jgi:hypothetical protein
MCFLDLAHWLPTLSNLILCISHSFLIELEIGNCYFILVFSRNVLFISYLDLNEFFYNNNVNIIMNLAFIQIVYMYLI